MNLLTLLVVLCVTPESAPARVEAANTHASAKTVRVLGYLAGMTKQQENRVVSGQHCGRGKEAETHRGNASGNGTLDRHGRHGLR